MITLQLTYESALALSEELPSEGATGQEYRDRDQPQLAALRKQLRGILRRYPDDIIGASLEVASWQTT